MRRVIFLKRFVTYLYKYERGHKSKNAGFVRVDIHDNDVKIDVRLQNCARGNREGTIYALVRGGKCFGIELGAVKISNGQGCVCLNCTADNLADSDYSIHDVAGIRICFDEESYLASCRDDEGVEELGKEEFHILKHCGERVEESFEESAEIPMCPQKETKDAQEHNRNIVYKKIELDQIHELPKKNWHYCNNSFLKHGFWNYGYLVVKKEAAENKEKLSLGVPGVFEKPEMVMAIYFGFPHFEILPKEVKEIKLGEEVSLNTQKNQEPKVGDFGCWFVDLNI